MKKYFKTIFLNNELDAQIDTGELASLSRITSAFLLQRADDMELTGFGWKATAVQSPRSICGSVRVDNAHAEI
ncbi:MAG: hypothetical protein PV340_02870, partial [Wolbachia sp.]|nr:hypothetical protein [Wolbachia sp.]